MAESAVCSKDKIIERAGDFEDIICVCVEGPEGMIFEGKIIVHAGDSEEMVRACAESLQDEVICRSPSLVSLIYCPRASLIVLDLLFDFNCFIVSGCSG